MFAVIKTGGKQYRVAVDDLVKIEKVAGKTGDVVEFADVLMVGEDTDSITIGAPVIVGALVTAEVVEQGRAHKVIAFKKRRRQNSRRTRGHRQELTTIRIAEILTGGAKQKKTVRKADAAIKTATAEPETKNETAEKKAAPKKAAAGTSAE